MWYISIILMIIAGIFNAIMDVLKTRYNTSIFASWPNQNWLKPSLSWVNKWKNGDRSQGERFLGSSTFLVWITDFWHLAKMIMQACISAAIILYSPIYKWWTDIFIMYCSFTIPFELFYSRFFIKKQNNPA